jgi:hypothetical protein
MGKIELSVQGLRYYYGPREFQDGSLRPGAEIYLSHDPGNAHDPNAVEVILVGAGRKLGHVPKTQAGWVSDLLRRNYRLTGLVTRVGLSRKSYPDSLFCVVEVELPLGCQSRKSYEEIRRGLRVHDNKCGVYEIYCRETRKRYVGSARNIGERFRQHFDLLIQNKHHSRKLQYDWNQYLAEAFEFRVLEGVPDAGALLRVEQAYIEKYDSFRNGYNATPDVEYRPRFKRGARRTGRAQGTGLESVEQLGRVRTAANTGPERANVPAKSSYGCLLWGLLLLIGGLVGIVIYRSL